MATTSEKIVALEQALSLLKALKPTDVEYEAAQDNLAVLMVMQAELQLEAENAAFAEAHPRGAGTWYLACPQCNARFAVTDRATARARRDEHARAEPKHQPRVERRNYVDHLVYVDLP